MEKNSKLTLKQQELKKKYEKNPKKYNEEVSKLYEKEGINPLGGCFSTMVLPLLLWGGVFGAVTKPLQNTLHISGEKISQATQMIQTIPGISSRLVPGYEQLQVVKLFNDIKQHLTMFSDDELSSIGRFSAGVKFMGISLLDRPNAESASKILWFVPLICFATSVISMFITQKMSGNSSTVRGCAKYVPYGMFVFTAYIAYTIPAAVGLYWVVNGVINIVQSLVLNTYFGKYRMNAKDEIKRFAQMKALENEDTP
jgi:YidC/Oxa1 family membrane protein insertase